MRVGRVEEELGANHASSHSHRSSQAGDRWRQNKVERVYIESFLNDAFSKDFRQNFLSIEASARSEKRHKKSRAQELPIATCTAVGSAHLSAPNLSNIIVYAAMERYPTFSGDHGALTNRHRRPFGGMSVSVPEQPKGAKPNLLMKERSLVFYIR